MTNMICLYFDISIYVYGFKISSFSSPLILFTTCHHHKISQNVEKATKSTQIKSLHASIITKITLE